MTTPLNVRFEMFYSGQWHDITADVRQTQDAEVSWGIANEASQASPVSTGFMLNNGQSEVNPAVAGRYSLRNPRSDLYGLIGRNTPVRVRLGAQDSSGILMPGAEDGYAWIADAASFDVVGDIDLRADIDPDTWRPLGGAGGMALARKYVTTGDQRSWTFTLGRDGRPGIQWSSNGTLAARITVDATAAIPASAGRLTVRATLDVNNGASGNTVTFYTGPSLAGPWTQLGAPVVTSGVTSIFASTANIELGRAHSATSPGINTTVPLSGAMLGFEMRAGIGGAVLISKNFTTRGATLPGTSFDATTVTLGALAYIDDRSVIGVGEVAEMPTEWDTSGNNVWVPVEAKSITRRLGQGKSALRSPLFRDLSRNPSVVAHWSLEDGASATQFASSFGHEPLVIADNVKPATYDGFAGSGPVATFGNIAHAAGPVARYTPLARQRWAIMLRQSSSQPADRNLIYTTLTGGSIQEAVLVLKADGSLRLVLNNSLGAALLDFAAGVGDLRDANAIVWFFLNQVGANVEWQFGAMKETDGFYFSANGTLASNNYGRFTSIKVGAAGELSGAAIGHVTLFNSVDDGTFWSTAATSLRGWVGEPAGSRMLRLSKEEGVPLLMTGAPAATERMGRQGLDTYLNLVAECAKTDMGLLDDHHRLLARRYLTRQSRYNRDRTPAFVMDYAAKEVPPPLRPVPDDQATRNDITVERVGGSAFRAVQTSGPMNINDPTVDPQGVGVYDDAPKLSLGDDSQVRGQAQWRLHLGTVDEDRYPAILADLVATPALLPSTKDLAPGSVVKVLNPPPWLPPEDIVQVVQGARVSLSPYRYMISMTCTPATPWRVATVSDGVDDQRVDTGRSTTTASFVAGVGVSLAVSTPTRPWTGVHTPFLIKVAGVVLEVTGVIGSGTAQTLTVTQTPVNGVEKTIPSGSDVRLAIEPTTSLEAP